MSRQRVKEGGQWRGGGGGILCARGVSRAANVYRVGAGAARGACLRAISHRLLERNGDGIGACAIIFMVWRRHVWYGIFLRRITCCGSRAIPAAATAFSVAVVYHVIIMPGARTRSMLYHGIGAPVGAATSAVIARANAARANRKESSVKFDTNGKYAAAKNYLPSAARASENGHHGNAASSSSSY